MTQKHTPGPWKVRRNESTNKPACEITTQDKKSICYMSNGDLGLGNARLIAAAPELLEALQKAESLIKFISGTQEIPPAHEYVNKVWNEARAAIAKAKGAA